MSSINKPAYYAVIPASVRYDENLPANAKLLFGEISALAGTTGECWASNKYFAELYRVKPTTVSEWVSLLEASGHISVVVDQAAGNRRAIRIAIDKLPKTSSGKAEDPSSGKAEDNNTSVNTTLSSERESAYTLYLAYFKTDRAAWTGKRPSKELLEPARKRYKLTPRRAAAIDRRLKDAGYNMLTAAIVGFGLDDFYTGGGNRGWVADLELYICKNYENVEKGANLYEKQRAGNASTGDDWAKLD